MNRSEPKSKTTRRPRPLGGRRDVSTRRSPRAGQKDGRERLARTNLPSDVVETAPVGNMDPKLAEGAGASDIMEVMAGENEALAGSAENLFAEDEIEAEPSSSVAGTDLAANEDGEERPAAEAAALAGQEEEKEEEEETAEKRDEEPQSFLAMYFRDMAELEVLRPEQEFETARKIEDLELELWRTVLGFPVAGEWVVHVVENAMEKPFPDFKGYSALLDSARGKASAAVRTRFEKCVTEMAAQLKELDIDRIFVESVVSELHKAKRVLRERRPIDDLFPFATNTKGFRDWLDTTLRRSAKVKRAKNEFVKANLRLVVSIARRFNHGRLPLPDLIQEGNIGLMKAVERYDYRRGFRFSTYASWWIRHAISRALADKGRAVRLPVHMIDAYHRIAKSERELQSKLERPATTEEIATATGIETDKLEKMKTFLAETPVSLDRPISDEDGRRLIDVLVDPNEVPSPPEQMMTTETQGEMLKLLGGLKPIEADILRKRFGLANDRERTLKEIGDEYHLSRERVRQLQEQALGKMRKAMAKREVL
jgi:RNA polymerase primary sigma factor